MIRIAVPVVPGIVLEQLVDIQSNNLGALKLQITVDELELAYWVMRDDIAKNNSKPRIHVVVRVEELWEPLMSYEYWEHRFSYPNISLTLNEETVEEDVHASTLDPGPVIIEHHSLLNKGGVVWTPGMN